MGAGRCTVWYARPRRGMSQGEIAKPLLQAQRTTRLAFLKQLCTRLATTGQQLRTKVDGEQTVTALYPDRSRQPSAQHALWVVGLLSHRSTH